MANLCFRTILHGEVLLGDDWPNPARLNWYSSPFDLSGFVDRPALLLMEIRGVDEKENFVTINAPDQAALNGLDTADAAAVLDDKFVGRILRNKSDDAWALTIFRVKAELKATGNVLGIHSRNAGGGLTGNRDDFAICRIFLLYTGSD